MKSSTVACDNCATELELLGDDTELDHGWVVVVVAADDSDTEFGDHEYQFCGPICVSAWASSQVFV